MKENDFNIEAYLSSLKNDDGLPLGEIEKEKYRAAIEANGLCGFDANGQIIQVSQPVAIH